MNVDLDEVLPMGHQTVYRSYLLPDLTIARPLLETLVC